MINAALSVASLASAALHRAVSDGTSNTVLFGEGGDCGTPFPHHFPGGGNPPHVGGDDGGWCGTVPHKLPFPPPPPPWVGGIQEMLASR